MNFESLILDRRDGVATITLNRPDALNALNLALGRELFHAALDVDDDPGVRCVVITGAGKAFCAGGDVKDFADNLPRIGALVKELTTYLHGTVSRLARSDKRSEEHTSELQSRPHLVCRLLLGTKKHTSELQSRPHLVCRLLLEKKNHASELQSRTHRVDLLLLAKESKLGSERVCVEHNCAVVC